MKRLNTFHLKLIAVICMLFDHIAYILIPHEQPLYIVFRSIGRLAAPLFWFCFVEGYKHTSNKIEYFKRLCFAAIIMGFGNLLLNKLFLVNLHFNSPNMFLSFALMVLILQTVEQLITCKKSTIEIGCFCLLMILSGIVVVFAEYQAYILASCLCFYLFKDNFMKYAAFFAISILFPLFGNDPFQFFMLFAIPFFLLYHAEKPKHSLKWFFYIFYPMHFWLLVLLKIFLIG